MCHVVQQYGFSESQRDKKICELSLPPNSMYLTEVRQNRYKCLPFKAYNVYGNKGLVNERTQGWGDTLINW